MLKSQDFEETAYRSCMGVLQLAKKHSKEMLEAACSRALELGSPNFSAVKRLIQSTSPAKRAQPLPKHENLRDSAEFS
jgi:hypothetical protein